MTFDQESKILIGDCEQGAHGFLGRWHDLARALVAPVDHPDPSRHVDAEHVAVDGITEKLLQGAQDIAGGDNRSQVVFLLLSEHPEFIVQTLKRPLRLCYAHPHGRR